MIAFYVLGGIFVVVAVFALLILGVMIPFPYLLIGAGFAILISLVSLLAHSSRRPHIHRHPRP